jgi:DNA-binding NtrC family response regulator
MTRILVADDAAGMREMLRHFLAEFECVIARDGAEAVEMFRPGEFGVVLLDLSMPVMDGADAAVAIRARDAAVQIVIFTGHGAAAKSDAKLASAGVLDVLIKPNDLGRMCGLLKEAACLTESLRRSDARRLDVGARVG